MLLQGLGHRPRPGEVGFVMTSAEDEDRNLRELPVRPYRQKSHAICQSRNPNLRIRIPASPPAFLTVR